MAKISCGCILVARQIYDSDIWSSKPAWYLKVWVYILGHVNHADNKYFKRGENFFAYQQIYDRCYLSMSGVKIDNIANLVRWLKSARQITTRKTTRGFIITVCKYSEFQNMENYKNNTENNTPYNTHTTQIQHYKQECNNEKNTSLVQKPHFTTPTAQEVESYAKEQGFDIDGSKFLAHYGAGGWMRGKTKITNWKMCAQTWKRKKEIDPDIYAPEAKK